MYVRQPGRALVFLCTQGTGRKEKAYRGGAESLSGCEPCRRRVAMCSMMCVPLGESKGLIEIRGAAEDKTTWLGGAGVNPFGHESLVVMALRRSSVLHHPGFWSQGIN
jgi:hypothetical protein